MGLADDMKAITDAAQALVAINKHIAKENNQECICYYAKHNAVEIAHIGSVQSLIALDLKYDAAYENYSLRVNSTDGTEFKVKINYCPMCGRKLN